MVWVLRYNLLFFSVWAFLELLVRPGEPSWTDAFGVLFSWKSRLSFRTVGTSRRELGQRHCLPIFPQSSGLSDNRLFLFTFSPKMEKAINQLFLFVVWIKKTKYFRLYSSVLFPSGVFLIGFCWDVVLWAFVVVWDYSVIFVTGPLLWCVTGNTYCRMTLHCAFFTAFCSAALTQQSFFRSEKIWTVNLAVLKNEQQAPCDWGQCRQGPVRASNLVRERHRELLPDNFKIRSPSPSNFGTERRSATTYIRFTGTNINVILFIEIWSAWLLLPK